MARRTEIESVIAAFVLMVVAFTAHVNAMGYYENRARERFPVDPAKPIVVDFEGVQARIESRATGDIIVMNEGFVSPPFPLVPLENGVRFDIGAYEDSGKEPVFTVLVPSEGSIGFARGSVLRLFALPIASCEGESVELRGCEFGETLEVCASELEVRDSRLPRRVVLDIGKALVRDVSGDDCAIILEGVRNREVTIKSWWGDSLSVEGMESGDSVVELHHVRLRTLRLPAENRRCVVILRGSEIETIENEAGHEVLVIDRR